MGATPDDARLADERVGKHHRLEARLPNGSTGTVWRAVDSRSGEAVVVRLLARDEALREDREGIHRFLRTARGASWLAVTTEEIPPRTWKSPSTVMRRGFRARTRSSRMTLTTSS